jgi:CHASE2 domain-containing sensor protein
MNQPVPPQPVSPTQQQAAVAAQQQAPAAPKPPFLTTWKFWSAILVILTIGALSYYYEDVKDQFPWLVRLQLWTYGRMSHAQARPSRPKWVVGVEVDNPSFFGPPMNRKGPEDITDRKFLAQVVNNAVTANAAVIALDINLVRQETNAESSDADDAMLWAALQNAANQHIPVVLTFAFDVKFMRPLNNVFGPEQVGICADPVAVDAVRAGFDHAPEDLRKVPLVVDAHSQDGNSELSCRSFALQIVDAYERRLAISPTTIERLTDPAITQRQFAYTSLLPQGDFPRISAIEVYRGDPATLARLDHRVVLVGGNRTAWPTADPHPPIGDMLDYHQGPEGPMAGMYYHANYVEGLLDDRIQSTIPRWLAALIDMLLATAIIVALNKWEGPQMIVAVTLLILVPVVIAYIAMVTLGYCFDFVLPVILSFLHPAIERYVDLPEHVMKLLGRKSHA